jgi:hypothetical protein
MHKKSKLRPIRVYPILTYYYSYVSKTYGALLSLAIPLHLSVPKTNLISYPLPLHIFLYNLLLFLYKNTPLTFLGPPRLKIYKKILYTLLHCNITLKGNTMFEFDKQIKEVTAQVKKYNEMWINWTITVLEQIKK